MDPPDFFAYRRMLNPWFSPAAVARIEPKLRRVVDAVIDDVIESGRTIWFWTWPTRCRR